jgi:hypothetical protein
MQKYLPTNQTSREESMMTRLVRPLLILTGLAVSQLAQAQIKPAAPAFAPACDLQELNRAYVTALNKLRHALNPQAPIVHYDPVLFMLTTLHVVRMEQLDSLHHDTPPSLRSAELCGTKRSMQMPDPERLAKFTLEQLQNSEGHCVIQSDSKYVFAAISACKIFYVVRLSDTPSVVYKHEWLAFSKLGLKQEVSPKQIHPLVY